MITDQGYGYRMFGLGCSSKGGPLWMSRDRGRTGGGRADAVLAGQVVLVMLSWRWMERHLLRCRGSPEIHFDKPRKPSYTG